MVSYYGSFNKPITRKTIRAASVGTVAAKQRQLVH